MAIDTRTPQERAYDDLASGAIYQKPTDDRAAHSPNVAAILAWIDSAPEEHRDMALLGLELLCYAHCDEPLPDHVKTAAWAGRYELARQRKAADDAAQPVPPVADDEPDERPLGTIDGCPVTGHYSDTPPYQLYYASLTWNGLEFDTDGETWVGLAIGEAQAGERQLGSGGDMYMREWQTVKALAHTDVVEQLIALVRSKIGLPPTLPLAIAAVQAERFICDDDLDERRHGTELGTDYRASEHVCLYIPDDASEPLTLFAFGLDLDPKKVARDLPALTALLTDPRVQAAHRTA